MMGRPELRFVMRLAFAHGRPDVDTMLCEMSASDLARWEVFYSLEPWGCEVEDHRAGSVASTIANFAGKCRKEGARPLTARDFFPSRVPEPEGAKVSLADRVRGWFGIKKRKG